MTDRDANKTDELIKLPCGCVYQDKEWLLVRIHECDHHEKRRKAKRPYRAKAECVRP